MHVHFYNQFTSSENCEASQRNHLPEVLGSQIRVSLYATSDISSCSEYSNQLQEQSVNMPYDFLRSITQAIH